MIDLETDVKQSPQAFAPSQLFGPRMPELCAPTTLYALFEKSAQTYPHAVALQDGDTILTYAQLSAAAGRVAEALRSRGFGPQTSVALYLERGPEVAIALLGILASGAAYVPLDPEWPSERVLTILTDSGAPLVFVSPAQGKRLGAGVAAALISCPPGWRGEMTSERNTSLSPLRASEPDDIAYIIFTSGSTGKPKGVPISHRCAAHLVLAEQHLFAIRPEDRVLQGFSVAFDASVEEFWLAWARGAALVVGHKSEMLLDLTGLLKKMQITVFSTVPTLLAGLTDTLPSVRLLIVGGEACSEAVAHRFLRPGRTMFNTYGPTEATVVATAAALSLHEPLSIGVPLPNYTAYILDETMKRAPLGAEGELYLGGVGLSAGYLNDPERTARAFVPNPFQGPEDASPRLYRTGDLAVITPEKRLAYRGRLDGQIKLRGFRIELGEIEQAIHDASGGGHAVAHLYAPPDEEPRLVAYLVTQSPYGVDAVGLLRDKLRRRLPPYMVPTHFEFLKSLPLLSSGKVDRRSLPPPVSTLLASALESEPPANAQEALIARIFAGVLKKESIGRHQDFFDALGGHSMSAAQCISRMRTEGGCRDASIHDLYTRRTIARLAEVWFCAAATPLGTSDTAPTDDAAAAFARVDETTSPGRTAPTWAYALCGLGHLVGLYVIVLIFSYQWLGPYILYDTLRERHHDVLPSLLMAAGALLLETPLLLVTAWLAKWTLIGRFRPGRIPLWSLAYLRFWFATRVMELAPTWLLAGTPLLNGYYRLMGARVGKNVYLGSDSVVCFDLVCIEDNVMVGSDVSLRGFRACDGAIEIGPIRLEQSASVQARCVFDPNTQVGRFADLRELTYVPWGSRLAADASYEGSPARTVAPGQVKTERSSARASTMRRLTFGTIYALLAFVLPGVMIAAFLPGLVLLNFCESVVGRYYLLATPVVAALFVIALCLQIAIIKWLALGRIRAGTYPVFSRFVLCKWFFDCAMNMSREMIGGLYATLYINPWLRLLGVRVGRNAEISTASDIVPDLLEVEEDAFLADCVSVGAPHYAAGTLSVAQTRVGKRSFVGNSACVPSGFSLGDDCLLGCLSSAPTQERAHGEKDQAWFGSPAIDLPQRQTSQTFAVESTYAPSRSLILKRLFIEAFRITLPSTCAVVLTCLLLDGAIRFHHHYTLLHVIAFFPLAYALGALGIGVFVIGVKWLLMGRYRAQEKPLWCTFVWRNELVTALQENLADPFISSLLLGTPFATYFFRGLGAKFGKRVYLGTTQLTEYDLISVGDQATLDADCTLQTHLFEDRVMKMSSVEIGADCSVGEDAVILYDTHLEAGSRLAALSLVMKGESLPRGQSFEGSPARRVPRRAGRAS